VPSSPRWLPSRESLASNRWLRWIGPSLFDPRLWQARRRSIATGSAVGLFFGLLIPVAQIPASAAAAVLLRANVPAAVAGTFVTNPFTFAPIYYAAWWVGCLVLGDTSAAPPGVVLGAATVATPVDAGSVVGLLAGGWWNVLAERLAGVGKPLMLGLACFAVVSGLTAYVAVSIGWRLAVVGRRRRRRLGRSARAV
jgi:uncharacterized protein (DUF2062 family)